MSVVEDKKRSLSSVIQGHIKNALGSCHVSMPAKVVKVDYAKQKVDVKPLLKQKFDDGEVLSLPVITDVPLGHLKATDCFVYIPVKVNDTVLLIFQDYSMDNWLVQGGEVNPDDVRLHDLSDCVAIPMVHSFGDVSPVVSGDDLVIKNKDLLITIKNSGKISIENTDQSVELLDLLVQLATACEAITTMTAIGVQPIINKATFTTLKGDLGKLKV